MSAARILVTDGQLRPSLAVVRSLGRAGYHVYVCAPRARSLAGASRYSQAQAQTPSPLTEPDTFAASVGALVKRWQIDLLLPMSEESMLAILPRTNDLPPVTIPFASLESFLDASDKGRVIDLAPSVGIAVPEQIVIRAREEAERINLGALRFPLVLKPSRSVGVDGSSRIKMSVVYAADELELKAIIRDLSPAAFPLLIQQKIEGPGTAVFLLVWDGQLIARFAHRRIRERPPSGGVSVLAESVAVDPVLAERSRALLAALNWRGPAMVEFKVDRATGEHYLMEINARFWGSLQLAVDAGVDFPRLLVACALGDRPSPVLAYETGVRTRWWWGEVDHLIARLRNPQGFAGLGGSGRAIRQFFLPGASRNEVFRLGDPVPFIRETIEWFHRR